MCVVVASGGEIVLEVNGWTIMLRPCQGRRDLDAVMIRQGSRVMYLELDDAQMACFDLDAPC
jgi:hypothetical protein